MKKSPTGPSHPALVPSQTAPGLEAAAVLNEPLPADPPTAHRSPVPDDAVTWAQATVTTAATAQWQAAIAALTLALGVLRSKETPELYRKAISSIGELLTLKRELVARMTVLQSVLGGRMDRTRGVARKVIWIYGALAFGEVALNTAAGVSLGEEPYLAVFSFVGLAAGGVALGWAVGTRLKDATDRIQAGPLPSDLDADAATQASLRPLFMPTGRGPLAALSLSFWFFLVALLGLAFVNGMLVGWMRVEAGLGSAWGPVAAMLVVAAAAPPYLLRNKAADLWEEAGRQYASLDSEHDRQSRIADTHTAAQRISQSAQEAMPADANAQYLAALAGGYGAITTKQAHIVGHYVPAGSVPVRLGDVLAQIELAQPQGIPIRIDDDEVHMSAEGSELPGASGGSSAVGAAEDNGNGKSRSRSAGSPLSQPYALEVPVVSGNGHRP